MLRGPVRRSCRCRVVPTLDFRFPSRSGDSSPRIDVWLAATISSDLSPFEVSSIVGRKSRQKRTLPCCTSISTRLPIRPCEPINFRFFPPRLPALSIDSCFFSPFRSKEYFQRRRNKELNDENRPEIVERIFDNRAVTTEVHGVVGSLLDMNDEVGRKEARLCCTVAIHDV